MATPNDGSPRLSSPLPSISAHGVLPRVARPPTPCAHTAFRTAGNVRDAKLEGFASWAVPAGVGLVVVLILALILLVVSQRRRGPRDPAALTETEARVRSEQVTPRPPPPAADPPPDPDAAPGPPGPAAGWYPDPGGGSQARYWNGSAWTRHTRARP